MASVDPIRTEPPDKTRADGRPLKPSPPPYTDPNPNPTRLSSSLEREGEGQGGMATSLARVPLSQTAQAPRALRLSWEDEATAGSRGLGQTENFPLQEWTPSSDGIAGKEFLERPSAPDSWNPTLVKQPLLQKHQQLQQQQGETQLQSKQQQQNNAPLTYLPPTPPKLTNRSKRSSQGGGNGGSGSELPNIDLFAQDKNCCLGKAADWPSPDTALDSPSRDAAHSSLPPRVRKSSLEAPNPVGNQRTWSSPRLGKCRRQDRVESLPDDDLCWPVCPTAGELTDGTPDPPVERKSLFWVGESPRSSVLEPACSGSELRVHADDLESTRSDDLRTDSRQSSNRSSLTDNASQREDSTSRFKKKANRFYHRRKASKNSSNSQFNSATNIAGSPHAEGDPGDEDNSRPSSASNGPKQPRRIAKRGIGLFPSSNWRRLRNTLKAANEMQVPKKPKQTLTREDSFLRKFSTRLHQVNTSDTTDENSPQVERVHVKLSEKFVIQHDGNFMYYWLATVTVSVLYNLWTCIAREAFKEIQEGCPICWFSFDALVDFIYILDIVVQFRTGYLDQGLMVYDSKKLRKRYTGSRCVYVDVACLVPLDLIQIYIGVHPMIRFPRFLKIYRCFLFVHMLESRTAYPNLIRVGNLTHILFLGAHWFAAFYYMISEAEGFTGDWAYPKPVGEFADVSRKYLRSLFWSTLTLTTIGDLPPPDNTNDLRMSNAAYAFVIVSYLIGVFVFATIVGQVGNVINNRNASRQEFERLLDGAKVYMQTHNVPQNLQKRVQRWYDYVWSRGRLNGCDFNSLGLLPDKLKTELAIHVNLETLKKVTIFQECQPEFLHDLVLKMKAYIFTPGDLICRRGEVAREMFIIADGVVEIISESGVMLNRMGAGDFFGEIGILNLDGGINRRTADVRSVGYLELFVLSRDDVLGALKDHPEAESIIRDYGQRRLREVEAHRQKVKPLKSPKLDQSPVVPSTVPNRLLSTLRNLSPAVRRQSTQMNHSGRPSALANNNNNTTGNNTTTNSNIINNNNNSCGSPAPGSPSLAASQAEPGLRCVVHAAADHAAGMPGGRVVSASVQGSREGSASSDRLSVPPEILGLCSDSDEAAVELSSSTSSKLRPKQIMHSVYSRLGGLLKGVVGGRRSSMGSSDAPRNYSSLKRRHLRKTGEQTRSLDMGMLGGVASGKLDCGIVVNVETCSNESRKILDVSTADVDRCEGKCDESTELLGRDGIQKAGNEEESGANCRDEEEDADDSVFNDSEPKTRTKGDVKKTVLSRIAFPFHGKMSSSDQGAYIPLCCEDPDDPSNLLTSGLSRRKKDEGRSPLLPQNLVVHQSCPSAHKSSRDDPDADVDPANVFSKLWTASFGGTPSSKSTQGKQGTKGKCGEPDCESSRRNMSRKKRKAKAMSVCSSFWFMNQPASHTSGIDPRARSSLQMSSPQTFSDPTLYGRLRNSSTTGSCSFGSSSLAKDSDNSVDDDENADVDYDGTNTADDDDDDCDTKATTAQQPPSTLGHRIFGGKRSTVSNSSDFSICHCDPAASYVHFVEGRLPESFRPRGYTAPSRTVTPKVNVRRAHDGSLGSRASPSTNQNARSSCAHAQSNSDYYADNHGDHYNDNIVQRSKSSPPADRTSQGSPTPSTRSFSVPALNECSSSPSRQSHMAGLTPLRRHSSQEDSPLSFTDNVKMEKLPRLERLAKQSSSARSVERMEREGSYKGGRSKAMSIMQAPSSEMAYQTLSEQLHTMQDIIDKRLNFLEESYQMTQHKLDAVAHSQDVLLRLVKAQRHQDSTTSRHSEQSASSQRRDSICRPSDQGPSRQLESSSSQSKDAHEFGDLAASTV